MGEYSPTLREAREAYFHANGFATDGGYSKKFEVVRIGHVPVVIPNPRARKEAIIRHDLHHIITEYLTDWRGEAEIACFELAAGTGRYWFAWLISLPAVALGLALLPRRSARAWMRGRYSGGLYHEPCNDLLLDLTVSEARVRFGLNKAIPPLDGRNALALLAHGIAGAVVAGVAAMLPLVVVVAGVWQVFF